MSFLRARAMPVAVAFAIAVALGVSGPLASRFDHQVCQAAGLVLSSGWAWACFAFLVGHARRSKIESGLLASSALALAVVVYYVFKFLFPAYPGAQAVPFGSGDELISKVLVWGAAAFVLGAPVGLFGNLARTPGIGGLPFRLLMPLTAFVETSARLEAEAPGQGPLVAITWQVIRSAAVVAFAAVPVHALMTWRARRGEPGAGAEDGSDCLTRHR
ncbi:hypothetical protein [Streptomyces sp. fd1-xmd]|uniref:hypothetical protein n=1 Tax=Streptomyces sp. fd1-xmd TaxID=1812480 RepID=UPI0009905F0B|nr:hypothetical protein [Streptomyces sp. fd1-xmd]AQT70845.1 hypothetical protein B1K54_03170 [Streptomyces sp. fd1-xmd]